MTAPALMTDEDSEATAFAASDLVEGLYCLLDPPYRRGLDSLAEAVAGRSLRLDNPADVRGLQRLFTDLLIDVTWMDVRIADAGRRPMLLFSRAGGTVVYVRRRRWGGAVVRVVRQGRAVEQQMSGAALARLLGVAPGGRARGLTVAPRLPLESLRRAGKAPWRRAAAFLALDRADVRLALVYGAAIGVLSLATPVAVQALVNTVALGAVLQPLVVLTVLIALVLTFSSVLRVLQAEVTEAIQVRMFIRASADLTRRLCDAPPRDVARTSPAELTARFLEVPVLQKAVAILVVDGIELTLKLVVGLALLAVYHPSLLVFSVAVLAALALVVFAGGRGAVSTAIAESDAKYKLVGWIEQMIVASSPARTEPARRFVQDTADHLARKYRDARRLHFHKLRRQQVGALLLKIVGSAALLGIGGALVVAGQLTLGQLVAAELVFASIAFAVVKLHKQLEAVYDIVASAKKLAGIVELPTERRGGDRLTGAGPLALSLDRVTLAYEDAEPIAANVAFDIRAGDSVAVLGAAGVGKTTLLRAFDATHTVAEGTVVYDGRDVRELALEELRSHIAVISDPDLAPMPIDANLRLARPDADGTAIAHVLDVVGLTAEIRRLPRGVHTVLHRDGAPLSRTAARRLAVARALLARPRLLLVDGGLDDLGLAGAAKATLLDAVFAPGERTVVAVSGDPDVLARCTRTVFLSDGQLQEVA